MDRKMVVPDRADEHLCKELPEYKVAELMIAGKLSDKELKQKLEGLRKLGEAPNETPEVQ